MTSTPASAETPRAFALSMLLHAILVGAVLFFAWWSQRTREETPQIFELVAGEGDDYAALEAPTTAAPNIPTVKLELPPEPVVVTPAPEPVPPTPAPRIEPAPAPKAVPKQETPPPKKKVEKKAEKAPPVKAEKAPPKELPRTTFDKFRKEHGEPKVAKAKTPAPITPKKINAESIAGRVSAESSNSVKSGAGGTALTRAEADLWAAYQAMIIQRIRRAMEAAGVTDLRSARVEFRVSADGVVSGARITGSSGNSDFDAAVLTALRSLGRFGPPPSGRTEVLSVTIEMRERA